MAARQRSSASALAGAGRPRLEKIVDSRATTGRRSARAVGDLGGDVDGQHQAGLLRQGGAGLAEDGGGQPVAGGDGLDVVGSAEASVEEAGGERVAGTGRVGHLAAGHGRRHRDRLDGRPQHDRRVGPVLDDDGADVRRQRPAGAEPEHVGFGLVGEQHVGAELGDDVEEALGAEAPSGRSRTRRRS